MLTVSFRVSFFACIPVSVPAVRQLLNANPLRLARVQWQQLCAGLPEFQFVACVLDHGVSAVVPSNRPVSFCIPNHGSCKHLRLSGLAAEVLAQEEKDEFIAVPPPLLHECCWRVHPLGVLPKGEDKCRIIHD